MADKIPLIVFMLAVITYVYSAPAQTTQDGVISSHPDHEAAQQCGEDVFDRRHRQKRFSRVGDQVWTQMPVTINFKQYHSDFSREDQEKVLQQCADMYTMPGRLWFAILKPNITSDITIYFKHFDGNKYKGDFGWAFAPQPGGTSFVELEEWENWKLHKNSKPILKKGQPISFKFAICHELGHALGLGHIDSRKAIMHAKYYGQQESKLSDVELGALKILYQPIDDTNLKQIASDIIIKPLTNAKPTVVQRKLKSKHPKRKGRPCRRRNYFKC